jgi:hypothetical protein
MAEGYRLLELVVLLVHGPVEPMLGHEFRKQWLQ